MWRQRSEGRSESVGAVTEKGTGMVQPAKSRDCLTSLEDRAKRGVGGALEVGASF